jgi:hypothetical protein
MYQDFLNDMRATYKADKIHDGEVRVASPTETKSLT